jgi:hypothetical protein
MLAANDPKAILKEAIKDRETRDFLPICHAALRYKLKFAVRNVRLSQEGKHDASRGRGSHVNSPRREDMIEGEEVAAI